VKLKQAENLLIWVSINEELLSDEKLTIGDFSTNATKEKHGLTKDELVLK
jgi:hypothetical protein